jgi:sugar/nucleoside kinase (ribokinase family)
MVNIVKAKVEIVALGHILNEKIIFPDKVIYPVLGSPVAYSSVCMASLGRNVGIVTKVGRDFPDNLLKTFRDVGVDTRGLHVTDSSTNNELIYDKSGNKTLNFISKAHPIDYSDLPTEYLNASIFYVCPMDYEITLETIKKIYTLNKTVAIDLGGFGGGTSDSHPNIKDGREIEDLCPFANIVKASSEDLFHIFGDVKKEEAAEKINGWGSEICIITLGRDGAYLRFNQRDYYFKPFPIEKFVDQTGAGDCFCAGFLSRYIENNDPVESIYYGMAAASYIVERSGGVTKERMPDRREVERRVVRLKEFDSKVLEHQRSKNG